MERASPGQVPDKLDAIIAILGFISFYPATYIVAGIDAVRLDNAIFISNFYMVAGLIVHVIGYSISMWAVLVNPYFSTVVRIQEDRGQKVISSGPYSIVRHPGYIGIIVAHLALPIIFGSAWSLLPTILGAILFVYRTGREDLELQKHLDGYKHYQAQVRWRLFPGVW